jgi:S1-C subfamily serine protease
MQSSAAETGTLSALSAALATAVERGGRSIVRVNARQRVPSTGVHWRSGVIVTADHTVRVDEDLTITKPDGNGVAVTLAGRDPGTDLAVLTLRETDLPIADIGDATSLRLGHIVLALGAGPRVSWGVVSALGGSWQTWRGGHLDQLMRLDVELYPGFSGGPLLDTVGRVVGITTSGLSRHLRLAIPVSTVNRVVDEILTRGRVARGYLGVGLQPVRLPETLKGKLPVAGAVALVVLNVQPDGPAAGAGLVVGDVVVALNGTPVTDVRDVRTTVGSAPVGSSVTASILRGGEPAELTITVGERPPRTR